MKKTAGRKPVTALIGIALLTGGCAQQGVRSSDIGFPDFFNSWSFGATAPGETPARAERTPRAALASAPAPGSPKPQTVEIQPDDPHLAPVVERHFAPDYQLDPIPQRLATAPESNEAPDAKTASGDLWQRIRAGMQLRTGPAPSLKRYITWIGTHDRYFKRVTRRSGRYLHYVTEQITRRGMPTEIALLPIIESGYKPFAYSKGSAAGVWQIIPSTGKQLGLKNNWWYDGRRDIVDATSSALEMLQTLNANFDGDWLLAVAAYNCGEGAVRRARAKAVKAGKGTDYWAIREYLPRETRAYVPRLLAVAAAVRDPKQFGLSLAEVSDKPYFEIVKLEGQIDLAVAARAAGIKLNELQKLNPGFKRFATDPEGPHRLLLPVERIKPFQTAMASLPQEQHMQWRRHVVRPGESLGTIASRYQSSTDVIKKTNGLSGNTIRAGAGLLVPVASHAPEAYALAKPPDRAATRMRKKREKRDRYTVKRGDSMWTIARSHATTVDAIAAANGMSPKKSLRIGQQIALPAGIRARRAQSAKQGGRMIAVAARTEGRVYTVRAGDTLWVIGKRAGLSVADLKAWNQIREGSHLMPGQLLKLYKPASQHES